MKTNPRLIASLERAANWMDPQKPDNELSLEDAVIAMESLRSMAKAHRELLEQCEEHGG